MKEVKKIKNQTNTKNILTLTFNNKTKLLIPLLLFSLVLVFVFGVSDVSAAPGDTIYVNGSSGNDAWNGQYATHTPDTNDGPKLTIENAVGTVNTNGVVKIANGTYTGPNNRGITIDKSMNITGESQAGTVIDAQKAGSIFNINSGVTVNLNNMTFQNGITDNGGAIYSAGTLTVNNCAFTSNTANGYSVVSGGGAIYNTGTLTVNGCIFTGNIANDYFDCGGAIYNLGTLTVNGSTFSGNSVTRTSAYGGAIYNKGSCTVTSSTFTNNSASSGTGNGGAIANGDGFSSSGILTVTSCTFTGNSASGADGWGGIIFNYGDAYIYFNRIVGNTAGQGNAIYNYGGTVDATNNWWGSNADPKTISNLISGLVNTSTWVILTVTANPTTIDNGATSDITADLNHYMDSNGNTGTLTGHIPDGIPVTFALSPVWGSIMDIIPSSSTTLDGKVEATYNTGSAPIQTPVRVYANVDDEQNTVYAEINILKTPTDTTVDPKHNFAGQKVNLVAHVTDYKGTPVNEGTVQFIVGKAKTVTANVLNGLATYSWTIPSNWKAGLYTITAQYQGTTNCMASTGTANLTVNPSAYLSFTETVTSGIHYYGNIIHYYLTVKNQGLDRATGVSVYDKLPSSVTYQKSSANIGYYKPNTKTWTIGTLNAGQTAKLDIAVLISKVTTITNTATLTESTYPQKPIKRTVSFNVPAIVTIPQLVKASGQVKTYYESHHTLPAKIAIAGQTINMPQLIKLLCIAILQLKVHNYSPIKVTAVGKPTSNTGTYHQGQLYEPQYLSTAQYIKSFIYNNARAPNYTTTSLGNIPFSKLVYIYAKVLNFYGHQNRLPHWVATYKI